MYPERRDIANKKHMHTTKILFILLSVFLTSCAVDKDIFQRETFEDIELLKISTVIKLEKKTHSKDITPDHLIGIGESIYPNKNNFKLGTPKTFDAKEKPGFQLESEYFYSTNDSSVKVILYQWDSLTKKKNDIFKIDNFSNKVIVFQEKFNRLKDRLTKELGQPIVIDIEQNKTSDSTFRDGIKWENNRGLKAYLFMFGNKNGYRQIRLAIYKN